MSSRVGDSGPELQGKTGLIVGAFSPLGTAIAAVLAAAGATIAVCDSGFDPMVKALGTLRRAGASAEGIAMEVVGISAARALVAQAARTAERLDVMVHVPSCEVGSGWLALTPQELQDAISGHLRRAFLCCQAAASCMADSGGGSIINVVSHGGVMFIPGESVVCQVLDAGVVQLTRVLAHELGPRGVRANVLAVGNIEGLEGDGRGRGPLPAALARRGAPQDVAEAAIFLASDRSRFVTGQVITVNGGVIGT